MAQTSNIELPIAEVEQIRAQMREQISEMQKANERIKKDQEEIERLKTKTRATLAAIVEWKVA